MGLALDVKGGAPTYNGQWAEVYTDNDGPAQRWAFFSNEDGSYRMMSKVDNQAMCISVEGASMDSSKPLHMWDYVGAQEQGWYLALAEHTAVERLEMSIFSTDRGGLAPITELGGHAFLAFKNVGSVPVQLGPIFLQTNQEMTICKWKTNNVYEGIWYNRDTAILDDDLRLYGYLTEYIDGIDLKKVEEYIDTHDDYFLVNNNCANLAAEIWNMISPIQLSYVKLEVVYSTPTVLYRSIMDHNGKTGKTFPLSNQIGYRQNGAFINVPFDKKG